MQGFKLLGRGGIGGGRSLEGVLGENFVKARRSTFVQGFDRNRCVLNAGLNRNYS